ncbi:hypothetical protein BJ912DRAFT_968949 [Pholiota molesta]|nr:hypothetical protein BJ912DRAFT_968949 [Pholiota molesta]
MSHPHPAPRFLPFIDRSVLSIDSLRLPLSQPKMQLLTRERPIPTPGTSYSRQSVAGTTRVVANLKRDCGDDYTSIYLHGRWRHVDAGIECVGPLLATWAAHPTNVPDANEHARRTIDLFVVSVAQRRLG